MRSFLRIFGISIMIVAGSCTEPIDNIMLDSTYKHLVVYGEVTTVPGKQQVVLNSSEDYFINHALPPVSGAYVYLTDGIDTTELTESDTLKGVYQTKDGYFGVAGRTYRLTIEHVDINGDGNYETYQAESYLPDVNPLDSITLKYSENSFTSGWEVQVWAKDPGDVRNFYSFKAWKNGILLTDTLTEYIVQNDDLFNGNFTYGITAQYLSDDNGSEKAYPGDTITFEIDGITEAFFNFIQDAQSESFGNNPLFSGPPANIIGNISNDALGFFTAYSADTASRIVPDYSSDN